MMIMMCVCVCGGQTLPLACSTHHTAICSACDWNGYRMWFYVALIFTEQFSDHYWCLEDLKKSHYKRDHSHHDERDHL